MGARRIERVSDENPNEGMVRLTSGVVLAVAAAWAIHDVAALPGMSAWNRVETVLPLGLLLLMCIIVSPRMFGWRWRLPNEGQIGWAPFFLFAAAMMERRHVTPTLLVWASILAVGALVYAGYRRENPARPLLSGDRALFQLAMPVDECRDRLGALSAGEIQAARIDNGLRLRVRHRRPLRWITPVYGVRLVAGEDRTTLAMTVESKVELLMLLWWGLLGLAGTTAFKQEDLTPSFRLAAGTIAVGWIGLVMPLLALMMRRPDQQLLTSLLVDRLGAAKGNYSA